MTHEQSDDHPLQTHERSKHWYEQKAVKIGAATMVAVGAVSSFGLHWHAVNEVNQAYPGESISHIGSIIPSAKAGSVSRTNESLAVKKQMLLENQNGDFGAEQGFGIVSIGSLLTGAALGSLIIRRSKKKQIAT